MIQIRRIETKGLEDLDVPLKMGRLRQWCIDLNAIQSEINYDFVFVDQAGFTDYAPNNFADLAASFKNYH